MKRILMTILVSMGISSFVNGQQTFAKEEIKEMKAMVEQVYKATLSSQINKSEQDIDCLCKVSADIAVDFIVEKAKQKTLDLSIVMEMFADLQNPNSSLYNEYMSRYETELKKKCGFSASSITMKETTLTEGQQTSMEESFKEIKVMLEQMCKAMYPEVNSLGEDVSCVCEVTANVSLDFIMERYKEKELDMAEFMKFFAEIQDPNSPLHNEYMSMLQTELEKKCNVLSSSITISGPATASIPLLKNGNMNKLKLRIGSSEKYYLMDSGASKSLISKSYSRELEKLGLITKKSFIGERIFETANGNTMLCSVVVLDNVKLGDFTLNGVEFAIYDEDVEFLFGKNILDAFSSWQVKNNNTILELVK
ncbi:MAG: retroviral-like aspartic protease family protein [Bacteroidales bacterium]|jgi:hypothetical protein|nr:retroviral-like aspartic protease family protein [Bacteroidales bacterium]